MATFKPAIQKQLKRVSPLQRWVGGGPRAKQTPAPQDAFLEALRLERRRTERSGRPFMLVLLSGEDLQPGGSGELAMSLGTALSPCIRETDVLGWYSQDTSLGLLMTEIGDASVETIEVIVLKLSAALQGALPPKTFRRLVLVIRIFPDDGEDRVFYPDLSLRNHVTKIDHMLKRAIDVAGSLVAFLILAPALVVIALLVKCTSAGPVLFYQTRIGRHGKPFRFYKFRTMKVNNDPNIHREYVSKLIAGGTEAGENGGLYKLKNDPRVTPLGRLLRRTSLDELPQFWNVLRNDMSLVGPRPPLPYEYECYRMWHRRRILELKPGLTGIWQIEGRSRTTFDEMVRMDIRYAKLRSVWMDLKIIFRTPSAMFLGRGAC
jgi:lipopolysaccharide/colanic/teichoic acid biosynthesis glycosyltransferase